MKMRNALNSPRLLEFKKNRQRTYRNKILLFTFALLLTCGVLAYVSQLEFLNISSIEIAGNDGKDSKMISTTAQSAIAGNFLWFFPKANIFYYPKDSIKRELFNKFKSLSDISLSIKENKILEISVKEREAVYTWCGAVPPTNDSGKNCFFLDKNGYIFDDAPYFSGDVYFKFYGPATPPSDDPTGSYFAQSNFQKFIAVKDTLSGIGLKPVALFDDSGKGDISVFLSASKSSPLGPEIIFKTDSDIKQIAGNLETALATEPLQTNFKNKYSSLLYIDLRYGNKVYYKFQ